MSTCKVHNVRFYKPDVRAIHCMAYGNESKKLAISRADSSIEVWDISNVPHIECTIPGRPDGSVEALVWCKDRLFSTGLHGLIAEYDLQTLSIKHEVAVTSGPTWCMAINKKSTRIAVGTEDGYINIYRVTEDSLIPHKLLDKQEGRILCLAWDSADDVIATGSVDSVRLWNVRSGHAIHRMTTGRKEKNKETIVWCIAITEDLTIVSGDSRGCLCFWNGHTGTQTAKFYSHGADVLCLSLTYDQKTIYCSGVDPIIVSYSVVQKGEKKSWAKGPSRTIHAHDIRAIVSAGNALFTGGIDGYLAKSSYPPKVLYKYPPILQNPCVTICCESRNILVRHKCHLEVWSLGKSAVVNANTTGVLPLQSEPVRLLRLNARNEEQIVCSSLSDNSTWLAYSTQTLVRFFRLSTSDGKPELERLDGYESDPAHRIVFAPRSKYAVVVTNQEEFHVIKMERLEATLLLTFRPLADGLLKDVVFLMTFSPNGQYLIAADHQSNIVVWETSSWEHYCTLPRLDCAPTALAVQDKTHNLVVAYANRKIVEFSLLAQEKCYTEFSRILDSQHPCEWLKLTSSITHVSFDPRNSDVIIVHDDDRVLVIDKSKKLSRCEGKIPRLDSSDNQTNNKVTPRKIDPDNAFHIIKRYKHIVHLGWLQDDEMVVVEVLPQFLEENLPPTLYKKKFGKQ